MDYVALGRSGLMVSRYVLGTLTFAGTDGFERTGNVNVTGAKRMIDLALEAGVNAIDTANLYSKGGSEEVIGRAIEGRRDDVLLFSKARMPMGSGPNDSGASRIHILSQIDRSLQRLKTDRLDLYWVHAWDGITPIEETVEVMSNLVKAGKIRYWGVSNYGGWQVATTAMTAKVLGAVPPIAQQINYTPEAREAEYEIIPAAEAHGLGTMVWSPLGEGLLTGKIDRNTKAAKGTRQGSTWTEPFVIDQEKAFRVIDVLKAVAKERGVSVPQVVLAWLRDRPGIGSIVIGARTEEQLRDNLASHDVTLSSDEAARIEAAGRPLAIYPYWHRAQWAMDRPSATEKSYLQGWRKSQGMGAA